MNHNDQILKFILYLLRQQLRVIRPTRVYRRSAEIITQKKNQYR